MILRTFPFKYQWFSDKVTFIALWAYLYNLLLRKIIDTY